jgi:electron transfer flavoprotein alpha subunit
MLARSDYAVVGDLHEVVAAVIEKLRQSGTGTR